MYFELKSFLCFWFGFFLEFWSVGFKNLNFEVNLHFDFASYVLETFRMKVWNRLPKKISLKIRDLNIICQHTLNFTVLNFEFVFWILVYLPILYYLLRYNYVTRFLIPFNDLFHFSWAYVPSIQLRTAVFIIIVILFLLNKIYLQMDKNKCFR